MNNLKKCPSLSRVSLPQVFLQVISIISEAAIQRHLDPGRTSSSKVGRAIRGFELCNLHKVLICQQRAVRPGLSEYHMRLSILSVLSMVMYGQQWTSHLKPPGRICTSHWFRIGLTFLAACLHTSQGLQLAKLRIIIRTTDGAGKSESANKCLRSGEALPCAPCHNVGPGESYVPEYTLEGLLPQESVTWFLLRPLGSASRVARGWER